MTAEITEESKVIEECKRQLATDFDSPARQILDYHGARLGMSGRDLERLLKQMIQEER